MGHLNRVHFSIKLRDLKILVAFELQMYFTYLHFNLNLVFEDIKKKLEGAMRLFLYLLGVSFSNREDERKDCNVSVCKIRKIHTLDKT
jgi:hypothetical protein